MVRPRKGITVATLGVEAPEPARREEGEYRVYSTDEQRRGAGCIGSQSATVVPLRGLTRRTLLRWAATLAATWPLSSLKVLGFRQQPVALTPDHAATLRAIAEVVLPSEITREDQHASVTQFVAWVANYREGAEMGHGYGTTRLRRTGPSPAATYPAQLARLESAAQASGAASFLALDVAGRRTLVEAALTGPPRVTQLPARPTGANIIADFMGMFFNGPEGYNLAYRAHIDREDCRGLPGSGDAPMPIKKGDW